MLGARATRSGRTLVTIVTGAILWTSIASVALAADKTYSATVSPVLVAGASYGEGLRATSFISLNLKNESNQARLGSANVTAPPGIVLTAPPVAPAATSSVGTANVVGGVLQLRNLDLAPGLSVNVTVPGRVECSGTNHAQQYLWTFVVKQANDFNGTGNDLAQVGSTTNTVSGNCAIVFSKQPKSSEKAPVAITSKIYDPAGPAVTVTVVDGDAYDTVAWWSGTVTLTKGDDPTGGAAGLGGTKSGLASGGSVTFAPTIDLSGSRYTVNAKATPTVGSASVGTSDALVPSAPFNIVDDAMICGASGVCSATSKGPKTEAIVDATAQGSAGALVILSINDPTLPTLDCPGYDESPDVAVISYNVTTLDGSTPAPDRAKVATFTLLAPYVTRSASKYEVCYASNRQFPTKSGALATLDPNTGLYKGLLPACVNKTLEPSPCVVSKALDNKTKDLVIVVSSPPGDPQAKF
jgi:hypothetical protein